MKRTLPVGLSLASRNRCQMNNPLLGQASPCTGSRSSCNCSRYGCDLTNDRGGSLQQFSGGVEQPTRARRSRRRPQRRKLAQAYRRPAQ
eukprot:373345-Pleurochrysis_carterae.AAC.2